MSWGPIRAARVDASARLAASARGAGVDGENSPADAWAKAHRLFLSGTELPARWAGKPRFVVLDTEFGLGINFLVTWAAWRTDPQRAGQLWYIAIAPQPLRRDDLAQRLAACALPALAGPLRTELLAQWPPLTPDLHLLDFEGGRVRLLLALGAVDRVLPELVAQVDAVFLGGVGLTGRDHSPSAPHRAGGPLTDGSRVLRGLHRLAAPGATLATRSVAPALRRDLTSAGFVVAAMLADADHAEVTLGRFAPRVAAVAPPGRRALTTPTPATMTVAVVGAGLAGAAVAHALARQGVSVQVFERHPQPAAETSGQAAGLFHGVVHGHDGTHARWLRVAAIHLARDLAPRWGHGAKVGAGVGAEVGKVAGAISGLWRGERNLDLNAMAALLARLNLPADYVQAHPGVLPNGQAASVLPGAQPAWLYPQGGWVNPPSLVADWLRTPGVTLRGGASVHALRQTAHSGWQLLGADGGVLAQADAVVLANAHDLRRLCPGAVAADWPLHATRAQSSIIPAGLAGLPLLPRPIADSGYALRLADGRLLCGGAAMPGDTSSIPDSRTAPLAPDHIRNLATLARLTGWSDDLDPTLLDGRSGWRLAAADRMPVIGPLPAVAAAGPWVASQPRLDQPRLVPRLPGVYVLSALGSRGLVQAALGGEVLASWITGAPVPAPASLLDAIDPARFIARAARRPA